MCLIFGDFNAGQGNYADYIEGVDVVPNMVVITDFENSMGESLKQFLLETRFAVMNRRDTAKHDNYTSISIRGMTVIDNFHGGMSQ